MRNDSKNKNMAAQLIPYLEVGASHYTYDPDFYYDPDTQTLHVENVTVDVGVSFVDIITTGDTILGNGAGDTLVVNGDSATFNVPITVTGKINLGVNGGAASASGLLMGVGTSADPATTAVADAIFSEFRTQSTATSGDSRSLYIRHDINGAGGGGDAARIFAKVTDAATTVRGAHISLDLAAAGSVSGFGAGVDAQVMLGAAAYDDTLASINAEIFMSIGATITGKTSLIRGVLNAENGDATALANANENAYLMSLNGLSVGVGNLFHANTAADATHGLLIDIGGTPYAIMLTSVIPS